MKKAALFVYFLLLCFGYLHADESGCGKKDKDKIEATLESYNIGKNFNNNGCRIIITGTDYAICACIVKDSDGIISGPLCSRAFVYPKVPSRFFKIMTACYSLNNLPEAKSKMLHGYLMRNVIRAFNSVIEGIELKVGIILNDEQQETVDLYKSLGIPLLFSTAAIEDDKMVSSDSNNGKSNGKRTGIYIDRVYGERFHNIIASILDRLRHGGYEEPAPYGSDRTGALCAASLESCGVVRSNYTLTPDELNKRPRCALPKDYIVKGYYNTPGKTYCGNDPRCTGRWIWEENHGKGACVNPETYPD